MSVSRRRFMQWASMSMIPAWNAQSAPRAFRAELLPSKQEIWDQQVWMAKLGPKYTGNKAHTTFVAGVPTIGYIPQPNYLLAGPDDGCIEKSSADLMHSQIQVFAKLVHTIDAMSAGQLRKT